MTAVTTVGVVVAVLGLLASQEILPIIGMVVSSLSLLLRMFRAKLSFGKTEKLVNLMTKLDAAIASGASTDALQAAVEDLKKPKTSMSKFLKKATPAGAASAVTSV